nr:MAG TPA_asm: hypothetical protein [Caudoviricetes sp.]
MFLFFLKVRKKIMSMLNFLMNDKEYEIQANMQVATILSQFDSNYIMDVISDTIDQQFQSFNTITRPNIVQSFEEYFKQLKFQYPTDIENIDDTRYSAYQNIIDIICSKFNLDRFNLETVDNYTLAFFLYDFFVSKFDLYMVNFYARFVVQEKSNIFINLGLQKSSELGDASSNYNRYAFSDDEELAAVVANLPNILSALKSNDISDTDIYRSIYNNPDIVNLFETHIAPSISIFDIYNRILFNQVLYPSVITQIRLKIQMENKQAFEIGKKKLEQINHKNK